MISKFLAVIRRHLVLTGLLVVGVIVFAIFSVVVAFVPMVVLLAPVGVIAGGIYAFYESRLDFTTPAGVRKEARVIVTSLLAAAVITFGLIQLVPYGRDRVYSADTSGEPQWANDRTRELVVRACYDCHSNQPKYPSYASVAPISWAVQHHIDEGIDEFNFSTFTTNSHGADDVIEVIRDGSMPPSYYTAFGRHPEAKLTKAEKEELIAGLLATPGFSEGDGGGKHGDGYGDDDDE